jgi:hypothetical protein
VHAISSHHPPTSQSVLPSSGSLGKSEMIEVDSHVQQRSSSRPRFDLSRG